MEFCEVANEMYWHLPLGNHPEPHSALRCNVGNSFICDLYTQLAVSFQGRVPDQNINLLMNFSRQAGLRGDRERGK